MKQENSKKFGVSKDLQKISESNAFLKSKLHNRLICCSYLSCNVCMSTDEFVVINLSCNVCMSTDKFVDLINCVTQ